ncbi:MAG: lamin tail domain-containing protein, partial [Limisphaerales bacterium]
MIICPSQPQGAGSFGKGINPAGNRLSLLKSMTRLTLILLILTHFPARASLPAGWSDADLGSPADAGSASSYANGSWTIAGGGIGISGASDQLNFASQIYNCDGSIAAKVTQVQNTEPGKGFSAAGVMLRDNNAPGAVMAFMTATASQGVEFIVRTATGTAATATQVSGVGLPVWVQVVRFNDLFSGYYSTDGTNWIQVGSTTMAMNGPALAGLAVTAANNSALNTSTFSNVSLSPATFGIYRELWTNLNANMGDTLAVLTNTTDNPNWPNNPAASFTHVFTDFETEINSGMNNYGQRLRAYVIPPTNGFYTFWIASDDTSQLFLSTNESPAYQQMIAQETSWNDAEDWTQYADQQSALIYLQGGCRYFLRAIMQQGNGGDNLSVAWQLPNGVFEGPMEAVSPAGTLLVPWTGIDSMPGIFAQTTNATVVESFNATFSVLVTNQSSVSYQWLDDGYKIAGATSPVYTLSNASVAINNGQVFVCVISNSIGAVTSEPIALSVLPDTNPPTVVKAFNAGLTNVEIVFSKPIAAATATNALNYVFTNGLAISGVALSADDLTVTLAAQLVYGSNYTIVINNIQDLTSVPNVIAPDTEASFNVTPYVSLDLGPAPSSSAVTYTSNGLNVTTWGQNIGGISDDCNFQYESQNGNFDVAVCLTGLSLSDLWAGAGLMARATLTAVSPYAAVLATPGMVGELFSERASIGSKAATSGSFPVNYPNTWLRLSRVGNAFTGYGSYDGTNWTQLGAATIAMPSQIYLGLAVDSSSTNGPVTAQFLDFKNTPVGAVVVTPVNPHEPLGPSARKTGIVISEIMYKPAPRVDGNNVEFLELYNSCPFFQDISSYQVNCADMSYQFPPNTIIPGNAFFVLAASPPGISSVYGVTSNVFGPYNGSLKKSETLQLLDEQSNVLLTVPYTDIYPWPVAADGTGHSIVLANPSYGEGDPRAWDISDQVGGTPGGMDTFHPSPLRSVVINEILPHSENPAAPQFIELYNHSASRVDVSGCILTDDPATNKYIIPSGTVIGPAGFVSLTQFGLPLNGAGETLYFLEPDGSRVLDAVQYEAQADGVSYGRWPDGAHDFYAFTSNTPGTNNSPILIGDVVINELMYDPFSGNDDDQYIELYNKGTNLIDLSGWRFTAGVTFTFPTNVLLGSNSYLVVARNLTNLFAKYPNLSAANTVGNYTGKLSHSGKRVALAMPQSYYGTNTIFVVQDEVTYGVGGRWGEWSGGGGSSLELIDPRSNHRLAANWADSDETQKSSWVDIENTAVLDNGANYENGILHAQIGLLDAGECLVDNIEVDNGGVNYVQNGTFESGSLANWSLQGDMVRSSLENSGYQSSHSLHIRCSDRIWSGDNSCQVSLSANSLSGGKTVTLRYKARWLHGWNEPLLRLNGNWLDATAPLPVPPNLGTPGAPNSQYTPNAGPALYNVTHTPTVPAASQPVVVTARVHDPDGLQNLTLYYRLDPATAYKAVTMNDKGTGGDAIAGDGIFSGTIPGQSGNQIVAFYLSATDALGASTRFPSIRTNDNEPVRECVVMFGDGTPVGSFGVYHLWITQTNVTRWANLGNLSNEGNDATFVNGNRVIYNMQGRFAGSPYHQDFDLPNGSLCHYDWSFNDDDLFLGTKNFDKIHQPGNGAGDDPSLQREECANTFLRALGVPWLYKRLVAVYVNGNRRGGTLMEDTQVPNSDLVKECFPNDPDGFLYKMQPWFEFAPTLSGYDMNMDNQSWCNIMPYTTTGGVKKPARYRFSFEIRRTPDSFNDFTNIFSVVDAASSYGKGGYVANLEGIANMENWMRVFSANHAAGNWDSF